MSANCSHYEKVFSFIDVNRTEMINWLKTCVGFESVPGQEQDVQEWLYRELEQKHLFDKIDMWAADKDKKRPNIVAILSGTERAGRSLILNGHVDVVPVERDEKIKWSSDPWVAIEKDGRICGRGSCDMKAGLIAMIWAAMAVASTKVPLRGDLYVECVVGEEEAVQCGTPSTIERGYRAPLVVIAEPSNCEILPLVCGEIDFRIVVEGKAAHSGNRNLVLYPQRWGIPCGSEVGVDAIQKMMKCLEALTGLGRDWAFRWRHELLGGGAPGETQGVGGFVINPGIIRGGTWPSKVADSCELIGDVLYPPWVTSKQIVEEFQRILDSVSMADDWLRVHPPRLTMPATIDAHPSEISKNHEGCETLQACWKKATGRPPVLSCFLCACDACWHSDAGIPVLVFGPGHLLMGAHGIDEHVPIDQMVDVAKTLAALILDWCGVDSPESEFRNKIKS